MESRKRKVKQYKILPLEELELPESDIAIDPEPSDIEGEVIPPGNDSNIEPADTDSEPSTAAKVAALVVLGGLALAASGTREEPAVLQSLRPKRRRGSRGRGKPHSAAAELPEWFIELDRVKENTVLRARRFTDKNWAEKPTEDDVIVLLGHVVRRKVASDTAMMLGNERLLRYALIKRSYEEIDPGFFSDSVKPVKDLDFTDAARFAAELTDKLGAMPLWDKSVFLHREGNLRGRIERIRAHIQKLVAENIEEYDRASVAVWAKPKRRGRNAERERLVTLQDAAGRKLSASRDLLERSNKALEALLVGVHGEAIEFLQSEEIKK